MYHGFYDERQPEGIEQYGARWCGINKFKSQVKHLKQHYNIISIDLLHEYCSTGKIVPNNAIILTMDDGYESNYSLAYPFLKKEGIPFSIFVSTKFIDTGELLWADRLEVAIWKFSGTTLSIRLGDGRLLDYNLSNEVEKEKAAMTIKNELKTLSFKNRDNVISQIEQTASISPQKNLNTSKLQSPLSWDQIQELANDPLVSIGSHSVTHPNLTTCSDEELAYELTESKHRLEEKIGRNKFCPVFCYPGGAYDKRVKKFVENAGYSSALTIQGKSNPNDFSSRYDLKRLGISRAMQLNDMIIRLCTC